MASLRTTLRAAVGEQIWRLYRRSVITGLLVVAIEAACHVVLVPLIRALVEGDRAAAERWMLILLALFVALVGAREVSRRHQSRSSFSATPILLERLVTSTAGVPADWWTAQRRAEFVHLVFPGSALINPVAAVLELARSVAIPLTVWLAVLSIDWRPAAVMVALVPILWLLHTTIARAQQASQDHDRAVEIEVQSRIAEFAQQQAALRTSGSSRGARRLIDAAFADLRVTNGRAVTREVTALVGMKAAVAAAVTLVVAAVAWAWQSAELSGATAAAAAVLAVRFFDPLADVGGNVRWLRWTLQDTPKLSAFIEAPQLPVPTDPRQLTPSGPLSVRVVGGRFRYAGASVDTLTDIDLEIAAGSFTAIVGPSGAGKTTLVSLLQRLVDPTSGTVRLAGEDARRFALHDLSRNIGYVPQAGHLPRGTLRDNVRAGRSNASDDELAAAAELVALDEVIARLTDGWETDVGDAGAALSGGERQRVHLARVTVQAPPLMILDEATSALDPVTERAVVRWIESQRQHRTVVVVAHNLHTIVGADQIVVLDEGRIVQRGTHHTLLATPGVYARMWNSTTPTTP